MVEFWIYFKHGDHVISWQVDCRFLRNRGSRMTPSILIRQLEEWSRHPVRGKETFCRCFRGKMLSFTNDNFEMPITRKSIIEYLPFELQNPFSTLLCFALCLRRLIYVYFISGTPSPCSFWLCSANGALIDWREEGEGDHGLFSWLPYSEVFLQFSVLPYQMFLLFSCWSHLRNCLLPIFSNCPFPSSLQTYGA